MNYYESLRVSSQSTRFQQTAAKKKVLNLNRLDLSDRSTTNQFNSIRANIQLNSREHFHENSCQSVCSSGLNTSRIAVRSQASTSPLSNQMKSNINKNIDQRSLMQKVPTAKANQDNNNRKWFQKKSTIQPNWKVTQSNNSLSFLPQTRLPLSSLIPKSTKSNVCSNCKTQRAEYFLKSLTSTTQKYFCAHCLSESNPESNMLDNQQVHSQESPNFSVNDGNGYQSYRKYEPSTDSMIEMRSSDGTTHARSVLLANDSVDSVNEHDPKLTFEVGSRFFPLMFTNSENPSNTSQQDPFLNPFQLAATTNNAVHEQKQANNSIAEWPADHKDLVHLLSLSTSQQDQRILLREYIQDKTAQLDGFTENLSEGLARTQANMHKLRERRSEVARFYSNQEVKLQENVALMVKAIQQELAVSIERVRQAQSLTMQTFFSKEAQLSKILFDLHSTQDDVICNRQQIITSMDEQSFYQIIDLYKQNLHTHLAILSSIGSHPLQLSKTYLLADKQKENEEFSNTMQRIMVVQQRRTTLFGTRSFVSETSTPQKSQSNIDSLDTVGFKQLNSFQPKPQGWLSKPIQTEEVKKTACFLDFSSPTGRHNQLNQQQQLSSNASASVFQHSFRDEEKSFSRSNQPFSQQNVPTLQFSPRSQPLVQQEQVVPSFPWSNEENRGMSQKQAEYHMNYIGKATEHDSNSTNAFSSLAVAPHILNGVLTDRSRRQASQNEEFDDPCHSAYFTTNTSEPLQQKDTQGNCIETQHGTRSNPSLTASFKVCEGSALAQGNLILASFSCQNQLNSQPDAVTVIALSRCSKQDEDTSGMIFQNSSVVNLRSSCKEQRVREKDEEGENSLYISSRKDDCPSYEQNNQNRDAFDSIEQVLHYKLQQQFSAERGYLDIGEQEEKNGGRQGNCPSTIRQSLHSVSETENVEGLLEPRQLKYSEIISKIHENYSKVNLQSQLSSFEQSDHLSKEYLSPHQLIANNNVQQSIIETTPQKGRSLSNNLFERNQERHSKISPRDILPQRHSSANKIETTVTRRDIIPSSQQQYLIKPQDRSTIARMRCSKIDKVVLSNEASSSEEECTSEQKVEAKFTKKYPLDTGLQWAYQERQDPSKMEMQENNQSLTLSSDQNALLTDCVADLDANFHLSGYYSSSSEKDGNIQD